VKPPRGLSAEEAAAWARVATTVTRLDPPRDGGAEGVPEEQRGQPQSDGGAPAVSEPPSAPSNAPNRPRVPLHPRPAVGSAPVPPDRLRLPRAGEDGLDSHWGRRFRSGAVEPDFTLDLHGHTLDQAHARLDSGLAQARTMGARVVLIIAGKPRPAEGADRGSQRGAIRRKLLDWLAAGPHGASVAAVRPAHRKHGGEGALYLILKRPR
jgi:DNA-nicking Smr family endonuclease